MKVAIVIGALLLATIFAVVNRYEIAAGNTLVFRLDRWTGKIEMCEAAQVYTAARPYAYVLTCPGDNR